MSVKNEGHSTEYVPDVVRNTQECALLYHKVQSAKTSIKADQFHPSKADNNQGVELSSHNCKQICILQALSAKNNTISILQRVY